MCGVAIDSMMLSNQILKRVADGDLSVINDINEGNANISEIYERCPLPK